MSRWSEAEMARLTYELCCQSDRVTRDEDLGDYFDRNECINICIQSNDYFAKNHIDTRSNQIWTQKKGKGLNSIRNESPVW